MRFGKDNETSTSHYAILRHQTDFHIVVFDVASSLLNLATVTFSLPSHFPILLLMLPSVGFRVLKLQR